MMQGPELRYRVLGPLSVTSGDGTPVALRGDLQRRLVAALLLHANRPLPTDAVADLLWGDALPDDVPSAVQTHVSRLRRLLAPGALVTRDGGYCLEVGGDELDSDRFDRLVTDAIRLSRSAPEQAVGILDAALDLWRGPPYAEFADWDAARSEASRLDELRLLANEERAEALLTAGRHDEAVTHLVPMAAEHPLRDRARALLMTALYQSGRQSEALHAYEEHRRRLADELGLDPSPALRSLERAILEHTLDIPADTVGASPAKAPAPVQTVTDAPQPVTRLIGRDRQLGEVLALLRTERAVSITGPGGVGKTRLALAVAHGVDSDFERVVFCELAPLGRADDVLRAVASRLGVESTSDLPLDVRLVDALRSRKVLVVLDNCEHVVDAAAALVQRLVEGTPAVSVLATSRERLAVGGERVYAVEPLDDEHAVELFVERSRAVRPGFQPDEVDANDVLYICQRLDRLPLAIELAAARSQALSVHEIADALSQRFRLLTGGRRTDGRQRSLLEAVRWSFDLLDDTERELCEQLSVFPGGATVESAAAVAGLDPVAAADALARLTERSLLGVAPDPSGATRFQMLETVRQYGIDRLTERGALDATRGAHAEHFVEFVERWRTAMSEATGAPNALFVLDAELANLRAVHAWLVGRADAAALGKLHMGLLEYGMQVVRPEVFAWAEAALEVAAADDPARAEILQSATFGRWQRGDVDGAWSAVRESRELARPGTEAYRVMLAEHGNLEGREGRLDTALALVTESAALAAAAGDMVLYAIERFQGLLFRGLMGDATAGDDAERWVADAQAAGNPIVSSWARYAAGEVLAPDEPERARHHIDAAVDLASRCGCSFVVGVAGVTAASLEARHGDPRRAALRYRDLLDMWQLGSLGPVGVTIMRGVAALLAALGEGDIAAVLHGAVATSVVSPAFGPDAHRQAGLERRLRQDLGNDRFDAAVERGGQLDDVELRELAAGALERAASEVGVAGGPEPVPVHQRG